MSLALTGKGKQALIRKSVSGTDYIVLETIDNLQTDETGLVSDTKYRNEVTKILSGDVADKTTNKLIKSEHIIGYKEAGGGVGVI